MRTSRRFWAATLGWTLAELQTIRDNVSLVERCTVMKQVAVNHSAKIHPRLSVQRGNVRISNAAFINAHPYVLKNHHECHALPRRFGDLSAVYAWFRRGSRSGGLERLLAALREQHAAAEDADCFDHDSTCAKAHPGSTEVQWKKGPRRIDKST